MEQYIKLEHSNPNHEDWFVVNWCLGNTCNFECSYCPDALHDGSKRWPETQVIKNFIARVKDHYFHKNNGIPMNRTHFQKHKLNRILEKFDSGLSEWQNMQINGYDRIWDCGHFKFEWIRNAVFMPSVSIFI
jgi:hypothetical protein